MGTGLMIRYVPMSSHHKSDREGKRIDVHTVSRAGLGRRRMRIPLGYRHYGLSKAIVCVSAKIHKRRGLSRVSLEDHPVSSLETIEAVPSAIPHEYLRSVEEAISSYHGTPSSSGRSSPTITETQSTAQGGWVTGNTTERSSTDSTYSWDEFDKQAAKTVQYFFDEIDSVLYEQNLEGPLYIRKECKEWNLRFLHLRILGKQLFNPQDHGFQMIERESSRPSTGSLGLVDVSDNELGSSQDTQGLSLTGQHLKPLKAPFDPKSSVHSGKTSASSEFSHLEEEVFGEEGFYEEIIAIDYKDLYEDSCDKKQLTPRRRRVGYPPITPNACVKDSVCSSVFDNMWQEIIAWMRQINKQYSSLVLEESKPLSDLPMNLTQQLHDHLPPSRETSFYMPKRSNTTVGVTTQFQSNNNLDDVLQISRKDLQTREKSTLHDPSETPLTGLHTARPASSIQPNLKNRPMTSVMSGLKYSLGARGSAVPRAIRLAPLDRSRTPNVEEDRTGPNGALKVTRITPHTERLNSPPANLQRNGALPPLGSELESSASQFRTPKKILSANTRASSAVDKDTRTLQRDRFPIQSDPRPSTTHAMRSDTPLGPSSRRASTPLGFKSALGGSKVFGITGNALQPTTEIGHLGHIQQEILEDPEGMDDNMNITNHWTPPPPSHHNPYRRLKQLGSLVRS